MCHAALERVFDLEPAERSLPVLQNLFRTVWSEHRMQDTYRDLFTSTTGSSSSERDLRQEAAWGREGLALLENYWRVEDASAVAPPNPVQREVWVRATLPLDPALGVTAGSSNIELATETTESFLVRGIVDRLDLVRSQDDSTNDSDGGRGEQESDAVCLRLIDYKTGKKPDLKYSARMNEKIVTEAFEQLKIYALLLRESGKARENPMPLRYLRLFYLTSAGETAGYLDLDLGATQEERDAVLQPVHATLSRVWTDILGLLDTEAPHAARLFAGCERPFCYCHRCRPRFVPGSVWEPPPGRE